MRPSTEQWRQLHGMSREIYGQPLEIWDHHEQPETREEASELIRKLHGIEPEEEPMEETRVCADCGEEKPITEFRKYGRGHKKECIGCDPYEKDEETQSTGDAPEVVQGTDGLGNPAVTVTNSFAASGPVQVMPPNGEHWCLAELRDPRLSVVEGFRVVLDETIGVLLAEDVEGFTLEHAAEILSQVADLDLS